VKPLKVFDCNYDGRVARGVCTTTQKRALELLRISAHTFRTYGIARDWIAEGDADLRAAPHVPMEARISSPSKRWYPLDTFRQFAIYENECKRAGTPALVFDDWFNQRKETEA
jgi:hypothetical protein